MVAGQFQLNLSGLEFSLLQAEKIRVALIKIVLKAFAQAGTQTVYIPGNTFHWVSSVAAGVPLSYKVRVWVFMDTFRVPLVMVTA